MAKKSRLIRADITDVYTEEGLSELLIDAEREADTDTGADEYNYRSYFQHRGFYSIPVSDPPAGTEPDQIIMLGSDNTYVGVATADDPNYKPDLTSEGDTAIYADADTYVATLADGTVEIQTGTNGCAVFIGYNGTITIQNDNGDIILDSDGTVTINGGNLSIDP